MERTQWKTGRRLGLMAIPLGLASVAAAVGGRFRDRLG